MTIQIYRGYELHINPAALGLMVVNIKSGAEFTIAVLPPIEGKDRGEQLTEEAKATVAAILDSPHEKKKID
jgi:hypothetical protein